MPGDTAGTSPSGVGSSSIIAASGAAVAAGGSATPTLNLAGVQIPYSLISLVTLTVQNSALTILLHYSRTAPNAKPYSAAAAVLLNEILKGSISSAIALSNIDSSSANVSSAAFARYNGGIPGDSSSTGGPSAASAAPGLHEKRASVSHRKRNESLGFGQEEAWHKRNGLGVARPPQRAWWLDFRHWLFRLQKLRSLVFSADCWKLGVPACCYVLQNNLQFVAATNLDVATFQVSYQMKILTTAFFSVTMLRKRLSVQKWLCLLGLASGVAVVQLQGTAATGGSASGHADMDRFTGFVAVVMACMTSGFAGVYFEKVLKGANADLWVRNIQLTLFSLPPALLAALFPDLSIRDFVSGPGSFADNRIKIVDPDAPTWLFGNFGFWALATVFCQVFGGLVTALVIRYSDNIAKGFATSLSIILSFIAGIILFNFQVTTPFLVGCSMVLAATWFYNQPEAEPVSRLRQGTYRPVNTVPPEARNGHAHGHIRDQSHSYAVEITSSPGLRRHAQGSDAGSIGGDDPAYPYASYPATSSQPPKFVNVSPFGATQGVSSPPPFLQEESVSPKSPVPPFLEGSPFGGGASAASKDS